MPEKRKMTKQVRRRCGKNLKGKRGPTTMVNFLYMKYALAIADCGSVNKAAEKLFIDQPNLSRALRELESSLGVKLFIRSAKGTTPTPDGEAFLEYAKTILMQVNTLEEMFKDSGSFQLPAPPASVCDFHPHGPRSNTTCLQGRKIGKAKGKGQVLAPLIRIKWLS